MPEAVQQGFDPKARMNRHEADWELVSVTSFDGLGRTQIERKFIAPGKGLDTREATALPFLLDATPNADDRGNEAGTTTDERRYVVNPRMIGGQFAGLWTGGPVKWDDDQRAQTPKHQVVQTLTRTWPAGHGYTLDEAGRYVFSADPTSLEYATAAAALMNHRPALASKFSSRLAFRDDVPGAYWREVTWRDFTHESMPYIEALRSDKLALGRILAYHFGASTVGYTAPAAAQGQEPAVEEAFSGAVEDLTCDIDPETNTVTVKCAVLLKRLQEPATVADLLALPRIEGPCERETLRAFGWTDVSDGEGYRYTHRWKWIDLKDTPAVRAMLEFGVHDKDVLPTLLSGPYAADRPTLVEGAADAANGRFAVGGKAWWRIVSQKIEADEKEGSLSFELVAANPEWFGSVGKLVTAAVENPDGAGRAERVVAPSLDHKTAEAVASAPPTDPDHVIAGVTREQVEGGIGEDVTIRKLRVWSWQGGDVPPGAVALDGVTASTARRTDTATRSSWDLTFERVKKSEAEGLLRAIGAQLTANGAQGRVVVREVRNADEGAVAIVLHAEGVEQKIFTEWLRTGTFFEELHRQLKFNVPESDLTPGGLDERTGDIVTSDRKPNDDGTFDETIDRSSPSEPRHVRFSTKAGAHGRAVAHDVFRNETAVPDELLDGAHAGSVQRNDHARFDGESVEVDDGDTVEAGLQEDALSRTETHEGVGVAPAAPADGTVVRNQSTTFPDGKTRTSASVSTPKPASVTFTTKEGSGHFVQDVTHVAFRNQTELPSTGREITSGSANVNEFGRLDGQVSGRDNENIDEKVHEEADTALSHTVTDRGPDVAGSPGAGGDGQVTRGALTTYPDGKTVGTETVETAKPASITFTTKEGSGHFVQDVTHTVFRNHETMPEGSGDITSGSASMNEFGRLDGQIASRSNDNIDESVHEETDGPLEHSVRERGPNVSGGGGGGDGSIVSSATTTYPDGKTVGATGTRTAKSKEWSFSYGVSRGNRSGTVTVRGWRNAPMQQGESTGDGRTCSMSQQANEFGLFDGHSVVEPDWGASSGGAAGGTETQTASYTVTREEERRVRNTEGHLVDQTRQVRYEHSILAGNISLGEAVSHISGGSVGSRYQATRIRLGTGNYVPGYISDKVTVTKDPWPAL